jgi:beta-glucosidase
VAVIRANSPGAQVGLTLNLTPTYAADPSFSSDAARRYDGHYNRWFLDPLYGRGYPEDVLALYGDATPRASASDFSTIAAPTDFSGVTYYTPAFVRDAPDSPPLRVEQTRLPHGEYTEMEWLVYPRCVALWLVHKVGAWLPEETAVATLRIAS